LLVVLAFSQGHPDIHEQENGRKESNDYVVEQIN
jgi:hypothetical protein